MKTGGALRAIGKVIAHQHLDGRFVEDAKSLIEVFAAWRIQPAAEGVGTDPEPGYAAPQGGGGGGISSSGVLSEGCTVRRNDDLRAVDRISAADPAGPAGKERTPM
ncbi:MAG: hypothetical protein R3F44_17275 [Candidatus Competibacteraceae bacterium]